MVTLFHERRYHRTSINTGEPAMANRATAELGIDIPAIEARLADNWSLPTRFYWDPAILELERDAIFARQWQYFGPLTKVARPGDVAVRQIGRYPVVVTRDRDGQLRAFLNVCRHRGYSVAERDQSNCARLTCRYHAWSYRLDGSLANAPDADGDAGFCKEELGLLPISVDTWGVAVMINPYAGAPSLRESHPRLFRTADAIGFAPDPARYTLAREITYEIGTNWKLWYDNGTECYHCPWIHGDSFGNAYNVDPADTTIVLDEQFTNYSFKPNSGSRGQGLTSERYASFQVFPGFTYIVQDDIIYLGGMVPLAPGRTLHITHYLAEQGADSRRVEDWIDLWHRTFSEDNEITAVQYENLRNQGQPWNRYVGSREQAAQHINRIIWQCYKDALAA